MVHATVALMPMLITLLVAAEFTNPPLVEAEAPTEARPQRKVAVSFSPLSVLMLAPVLEVEAELASSMSLYGVAEFYPLWNGYGVQAGVRNYFGGEVMRGLFVDLHFRSQDLLFNQLVAGGGIELGAQHHLSEHWSFLWSVGVDVGLGRWAMAGDFAPLTAIASPKLRLMIGYRF